MKITAPNAQTATSQTEATSPEAEAEIARLRAERAMLANDMRLKEEDPYEKVERLHQNNLKALPVIGSKSPTANVGKGPQPGDPGVGKAAEFVPITLKG